MSTAWHCSHCHFTGEENVRTVVELRDSMYGRPPTLDKLECDQCPQCGDTASYRLFTPCIECKTRYPDEEGSDFCKTCWPIVEAREEAEFQVWKHRFHNDVRSGVWPIRSS